MTALRRLLGLMRPQAWWMAFAAVLSALATLAHAALLATSGWFITAMALAGVAGVLINYFAPSAMIRAFAIVRILGRYAERLVGHEATLRFVACLRPWLFERLERGTPAASDALRQGDVLTRLRGDIDRLEQAFLRVVAPVFAAILVLVPVLWFIARHDGRMAALVAGFAGLAGIALPAILHQRNATTVRRVVERTATLNAALVEDVEGLAELAIYDPHRRHRAAVLATSDALVEDERRLAGVAALTGAVVPLAANASVLAIAALGLAQVATGGLAVPDVPMLALLALGAFEAMAPLPLVFPALTAVLASARRVFDLADRPAPVADPATPRAVPPDRSLALREVGFRYPDAAAATLAGVSLDLPPGRRIAIIGASGSGKSTLAELVARLRPADNGEITLGDVSYGDLSGDDVRSRVALLTQQDHLFSTTVRDNLLLARPEATPEELREACRVAQVLAFVEAQPDGFDTQVGSHGRQVSGGEARRLLLARTLLARRPILVLDEPTEGLDGATEARLLDALFEQQGETAILLLTHRAARLERMDEILLLEQGRVVRRGAPAEMADALQRLASA